MADTQAGFVSACSNWDGNPWECIETRQRPSFLPYNVTSLRCHMGNNLRFGSENRASSIPIGRSTLLRGFSGSPWFSDPWNVGSSVSQQCSLGLAHPALGHGTGDVLVIFMDKHIMDDWRYPYKPTSTWKYAGENNMMFQQTRNWMSHYVTLFPYQNAVHRILSITGIHGEPGRGWSWWNPLKSPSQSSWVYGCSCPKPMTTLVWYKSGIDS